MNDNKSTFLNALKDEFGFDLTLTENGAYTFKTTNSKLLDLFFKAGALRNEITRGENNKKVNSYINVSDRVKKIAIDAFKEDEDLTLKILLYSRDILNGMGERVITRQMIVAIFNYVNSNLINKDNIEAYEEKFISLLKGIKDLGRWDDLVDIYYAIYTYSHHSSSFQKFILNEIILMIQTQLLEDISNYNVGKPVSLLAKWLPSVNTSSEYTKELAKLIRVNLKLNAKENKCFSSEEYRKTLAKLRKHIKIIENNLREKDYTFDYSNVPSKAMAKYSKAFNKNDKERFNEYLRNLSHGEVKINTKTLTPANICVKIRYMEDERTEENERILVNEQWKNMVKEFEELKDVNAIVACDVSGSMYSGSGELPIDVSIGLALFFAYKATGPFANHFIDFCGKPEIHKIDQNDSIIDNYEKVRRSSRDMNTDIDAVFDTLLNAAKNHKAKQEDLPKYLIIVSDMEFDACKNWNPGTRKYENTNFNTWKKSFKEAGYELPTLIFWNVDSRHDISPAQSNENVIFISGRSSNGFKMMNILDKYEITDNSDLAFFVMLKTLERYNIYFNKE